MAKQEYLGPQPNLSQVPDFRFRDNIEHPWGSYEKTMGMQGNGWGGGYDTAVHVDYMVSFAADAFRHFSGYQQGQFELGTDQVTYEEVLAYVRSSENQSRFGVHAFEEEIAGVAYKYITGQGEDYETFAQL